MQYIHRIMEDTLLSSLESPDAIFILGPRQVGKTTLLKRLMEVVGDERALYYDIERPQDYHLFTAGYDALIAHLRLNKPSDVGRIYIFVDEIQYLPDLSKVIKLLVDHHNDEFKLVLTGSSSALIMQQFQESLVGRKRVFTLYPLSFSEFCRFRGEDKIADYLQSANAHTPHNPLYTMQIKMQELTKEYMLYGGYPKIVLQDKEAIKAELLSDLVSSIILKDIRHIFRIEKPDQLNHLVHLLAGSIGKEFNISSLSREIGLHRDTLSNYLMVLQSSFIIRQIKPFFNNPAKELRKMPKAYFIDTGIRNSLLNNFQDIKNRSDGGELFENMVFLNLLHKQTALSEIKYWKSKNYQEVDFVRIDNTQITAYEVKLGKDRQTNLAAFHNLYPQAKSYLVRWDYSYMEDELPGWF